MLTGSDTSQILPRRASPDYFEHSLGVLSFHRGCPIGFARGAPRALLRTGYGHRTGYFSCDLLPDAARSFGPDKSGGKGHSTGLRRAGKMGSLSVRAAKKGNC